MGTLIVDTSPADLPPLTATSQHVSGPIIARSNPYDDLRPFIEHLWVTNAAMCRSVYTDLFPRGQNGHATKEEEDNFIAQYFLQDTVQELGARFLKQILYSIALYNDDRVRQFALEWSKNNRDLLEDHSILKQICRTDTSIGVFFSKQESGEHDNAFLARSISAIRSGLSPSQKVEGGLIRAHEGTNTETAKKTSRARSRSASSGDDDCAVYSTSSGSPEETKMPLVARSDGAVIDGSGLSYSLPARLGETSSDAQHQTLLLPRPGSAPQKGSDQVAIDRLASMERMDMHQLADGRANNVRAVSHDQPPYRRNPPGQETKASIQHSAYASQIVGNPSIQAPYLVHAGGSQRHAGVGSYSDGRMPPGVVFPPQFIGSQAPPHYAGHFVQVPDGATLPIGWPVHAVMENQSQFPADQRHHNDQGANSHRDRGGRGGYRARGGTRGRGNNLGNQAHGYFPNHQSLDPESYERQITDQGNRWNEARPDRRSSALSSDNWREKDNVSASSYERRVFSDQPPVNGRQPPFGNTRGPPGAHHQGSRGDYHGNARRGSQNQGERSTSVQGNGQAPGMGPRHLYEVNQHFIGGRRNDVLELVVLNIKPGTDSAECGRMIASFISSGVCQILLNPRWDYGFVRFETSDAARMVLEKGQGAILNGRRVRFEVPRSAYDPSVPDYRTRIVPDQGLTNEHSTSRQQRQVSGPFPHEARHQPNRNDWTSTDMSVSSSAAPTVFDHQQHAGGYAGYAISHQHHGSGMIAGDAHPGAGYPFPSQGHSAPPEALRNGPVNAPQSVSEEGIPTPQAKKKSKNKKNNGFQQDAGSSRSRQASTTTLSQNTSRSASRLETNNESLNNITEQKRAQNAVKNERSLGSSGIETEGSTNNSTDSQVSNELQDSEQPNLTSSTDQIVGKEGGSAFGSKNIGPSLPVTPTIEHCESYEAAQGSMTDGGTARAADVDTSSSSHAVTDAAEISETPKKSLQNELATPMKLSDVQSHDNGAITMQAFESEKSAATPEASSSAPLAKRPSARSITPMKHDFSSPQNGDDVDDSFQTAAETPLSSRSISEPPSASHETYPVIKVEEIGSAAAFQQDTADRHGSDPDRDEAPTGSEVGEEPSDLASLASTVTSPTTNSRSKKLDIPKGGPQQTQSLSPFAKQQKKKKDKKARPTKGKATDKGDAKAKSADSSTLSTPSSKEPNTVGLGINIGDQAPPELRQQALSATTSTTKIQQDGGAENEEAEGKSPSISPKSNPSIFQAATAALAGAFGSKHKSQSKSTGETGDLSSTKPGTRVEPRKEDEIPNNNKEVDQNKPDPETTPTQAEYEVKQSPEETLKQGSLRQKVDEDDHSEAPSGQTKAIQEVVYSASGTVKSKKSKHKKKKKAAPVEEAETALQSNDKRTARVDDDDVQSTATSLATGSQDGSSVVSTKPAKPRIPTPSSSSGLIEAPTNKLVARKQQKSKSRQTSGADNTITLDMEPANAEPNDVQDEPSTGFTDIRKLLDEHKANNGKKRKQPDDRLLATVYNNQKVSDSQYKLREMEHSEKMASLRKRGDKKGIDKEEESWGKFIRSQSTTDSRDDEQAKISFSMTAFDALLSAQTATQAANENDIPRKDLTTADYYEHKPGQFDFVGDQAISPKSREPERYVPTFESVTASSQPPLSFSSRFDKVMHDAQDDVPEDDKIMEFGDEIPIGQINLLPQELHSIARARLEEGDVPREAKWQTLDDGELLVLALPDGTKTVVNE